MIIVGYSKPACISMTPIKFNQLYDAVNSANCKPLKGDRLCRECICLKEDENIFNSFFFMSQNNFELIK